MIIRGGWVDVPLNTSDAYFSKHIILNDVTVNPNWNVLQSIIKSKNSFKGNPYKKYTDLESEAFKQKIRPQEKVNHSPIKNKRTKYCVCHFRKLVGR